MARTWTKEQVIEAIRAGYRDGDPLRYEIRAGDSGSGQKFFGKWQMAMAAAGLSRSARRWSKQRVLDEIRAQLPIADGNAQFGPSIRADRTRRFDISEARRPR